MNPRSPAKIGSDTPWIFVSAAPPWPVRSGVQTKLVSLLETSPRRVELLLPEMCDSPEDVVVHVVPRASWFRRVMSLFKGMLPAQSRIDAARVADKVLEICHAHNSCVVHFDTIATTHALPVVRERLEGADKSVRLIASLNDSYSFLRAENPRGGRLRRRVELAGAKLAERRDLPAADLVDVVSLADVGWLAGVVPEANVRVVPLAVRDEWSDPGPMPKEIDLLLFSASAGLVPFLTAGVARLRSVIPHARVAMIGPEPSSDVARLIPSSGVQYMGFVADIATTVSKARAILAPSQQRCGMSNRALLAMSVGTAVVGGRCLLNLPGSLPGRDFLVGFTPEEIADRAAEVLQLPDLAASLSAAGRDLIAEMPRMSDVGALYWSSFIHSEDATRA